MGTMLKDSSISLKEADFNPKSNGKTETSLESTKTPKNGLIVASKKFSVIIPCYKQEATLSRAIRSVLDQNYKNVEIIVVLDGESQEGQKICSLFPQILFTVTGKTNKGAPVARNLGATLADGGYFLFLDSDTFLYPGALRAWADAFEAHPEADFLYGGYKLTGGESYFSDEFDPYFLKITNYIDGNFPMKKEVFPTWDESLKSLQDWDLWLRIVDKGGKGHFMKNQFFFQKDLPKSGSISFDSHRNWFDRLSTVKKKHNIPTNRVCLTSYAATHHAKRVAKVLGFDYVDPVLLFIKDFKYKVVHLIGHFPANAEHNLLPFMDGSKEPPIMNEKLKKVIHWIGSDVLQMRQANMGYETLKKFVDAVNNKFIQFCQSEQNAKELKEIGLNVRVLPLPIEIVRKDIPLPKEFTVAIYDHGTNDIYNESFMFDIAAAMPDIKFISFGNPTRVAKTNIKNFEFIGHKPVDEIVKLSSVLLRITRHDGYPVSPIEFMCRGRAVITNVEVLDKCIQVKLDLGTMGTYVEAKKTVIKEIRTLKKKYPNKKYFDDAFEHFKKLFNPARLRMELLKLV